MTNEGIFPRNKDTGATSSPRPQPQTLQKHLVLRFCQVRRGWRPVRPRPALPFSSTHPTPPHLTSGLQMFQKRTVCGARTAQYIACLRKSNAKHHHSSNGSQSRAVPTRRSAARRGRGRPRGSAFDRWPRPAVLGARGPPGVRQREPAACAGGLGGRPRESAPERTWLRPRLPPQPRVLSSGLGDAPRSGRCPPPPTNLINSTPPSPARG